MKTIIKLLIVLAFMNALVRSAAAYWTYYQLKDAAQQTIVFAGREPSVRVHRQIMQTAAELDVPLEPQDLRVRRTETRRVAEASYVQPVELFPRYVYPVTFSFSVNAMSTPGLPNDDTN
jgi:hypothetical protein